jgi:hypothetical protein
MGCCNGSMVDVEDCVSGESSYARPGRAMPVSACGERSPLCGMSPTYSDSYRITETVNQISCTAVTFQTFLQDRSHESEVV